METSVRNHLQNQSFSEQDKVTYLQNCWEHSFLAFVCLSLLFTLLNVLCKLIEQVINDLGRKDLNAVIVSEILCFGHDLHVES